MALLANVILARNTLAREKLLSVSKKLLFGG